MNGSIIVISPTSVDLKMAEISLVNGVRNIRSLKIIRLDGSNDPHVSDAIRSYIDENHPDTKKTVLVLSSLDLYYRDFSLPFDAEKKVVKAIHFEISSEYPSDEYIFDHIKGIPRETGTNLFWAAVARKEMLNQRIKQVEDTGLQIAGITCDISTLGNYFVQEEEALVMDMGQSHTLFALYVHGVPLLMRGIPMGLEDLIPEKGSHEDRHFKALSGEIKRTIHSFNERSGIHSIKIHVVGNILLHRAVLDILRQMPDFDFLMETRQDNSIRVEGGKGSPLSVFAAVLGAMEWKKKEVPFFDFFKNEFLKVDPRMVTRRYFRWGLFLAGSILVTVFLSLWLNVTALERRRDYLDKSIRETFTSAFPHVRKVVDEVKQARSILDAKRSEYGENGGSQHGSILNALKVLSQNIPAETSFQIVSLFWERGQIEINGRTDSFKTVNVIQEKLTDVPEFSAIVISNAKQRIDGKDVEFKITIQIKSQI